MRCSDCGNPIPDGMQCAVWELPKVRFICELCSNNPKYSIAEEITGGENERQKDV